MHFGLLFCCYEGDRDCDAWPRRASSLLLVCLPTFAFAAYFSPEIAEPQEHSLLKT